MVEHGGCREKGSQDKDEAVLPEATEEFLVREHEDREENDEDEGRDPKGDVGMEAGPKDETRQEKVAEPMGAKPAEEAIEGKSEEKGRHDGPKADAGEVDSPIRGSQHKSRDEGWATPVEELTGEEVEPEDGKGTKEDRCELESGDGIAKYRDEKGLDIDKEPLPTEVRWVKELVGAGFDGVDGINAIRRFIGVESDRNLLNMIEANDEGEEEDGDEGSADKP